MWIKNPFVLLKDVNIVYIFPSYMIVSLLSVWSKFAYIMCPLRWEKDGNISRECWLKAGEQGLLGTDTPAEHGGIGGTFKDAAIIMEEQ